MAPLPAAPSAPSGASGSGYFMASSQGLAPEGFKLAMKLDPRPGEDGIIRDGAPVTVEVDLCGSTADAGKTLHFLFDWDFNDLADVHGTGDACHQRHTYRVPADATKDVVLESNVCVTNGDPGVHDGSTYFSCRVVRVALPKAPAFGTCATGVAPGCLISLDNAFYPEFSIFWPGGTGPYGEGSVPGFDASGCSADDLIGENGSPVVMACSEEQAEALCGGEPAEAIALFAGGELLWFCGEVMRPAGSPVQAPHWSRR